MKSDDGTKLIKAWAENLDDVNNIVKNLLLLIWHEI